MYENHSKSIKRFAIVLIVAFFFASDSFAFGKLKKLIEDKRLAEDKTLFDDKMLNNMKIGSLFVDKFEQKKFALNLFGEKIKCHKDCVSLLNDCKLSKSTPDSFVCVYKENSLTQFQTL